MATVTTQDFADFLRTYLETFTTEETTTPEGEKVTRKRHETDPPTNFRAGPRFPRPGPLPVLVGVGEIAKNAKTEEHRHVHSPGPEDSPEAIYAHMARHIVTVARADQAKGIAVKSVSASVDGFVFEIVEVRS